MMCSNLLFIMSSHVLSMISVFAGGNLHMLLPTLDVHTGIFPVVLIVFTFIFISVISWYLFSVWLFLDSQSVMYRSRPGLYLM